MADERQHRRGVYKPNPKRHSIKNQSGRPAAGAPAASGSSFVRHEPCPSCGSSDALGRYDDGHGYCFSCKYWEAGNGPLPAGSGQPPRPPLELLRGQPEPLRGRRITLETCQRFDYWIGELGGEDVHIANYHDADGRRVAQKIRTADKRFYWRGDPQQAVLFGQQLWRPRSRYGAAELDAHGRHAPYLAQQTDPPHYCLILTEGEIDAMSVAQVFELKQPVVSVPSGAAGALGAVRKNFDWIALFHNIVFVFDQDDAGEKAARECAALFPDRARIARLPLKDANDMLKAGREGELLRAIHEAQPPGTSRP